MKKVDQIPARRSGKEEEDDDLENVSKRDEDGVKEDFIRETASNGNDTMESLKLMMKSLQLMKIWRGNHNQSY
jgi:L-fucose isomerase-like protein